MMAKLSRSTQASSGARKDIRRLQSLIEASKILNSTFDLDKLLSIILNLATRNLAADRGTIYLIDEQTGELWSKVLKGSGLVEIRLPIGTGISGSVAKTGRTINLEDVSKDKRFYGAVDQKSGFQTKTMLCMPMKNREGKTIGVFQIINKKKGAFNKEDEVFLKAFSEHAALAIENARLYQASMENERVEKELQIAADIQQRLLPKDIIPIPNYEVAAAAQPCKTIGGDFYDVMPIGNNRFAFTMADVTGKGIPAALLVSTLHASLKAYIEQEIELPRLVFKLNNLVYENSPAERFITFFIMVLDCNNQTLSYVNAGHNSPYLFRAHSDEIIELSASGLPLGMMENMTYEQNQVSLVPADVVTLYTDGVTEAMNKSQEQYGDDRFKKCVLQHVSSSPTEIRDHILDDVRQFIAAEPPSDDLTLLVAKRV